MAENDKLKRLYSTLQSENYDVPEYSQFEKDMKEEKNLKSVYGNLKNDGYDMPEYEEYLKDMGYVAPAVASGVLHTPLAKVSQVGASAGKIAAQMQQGTSAQSQQPQQGAQQKGAAQKQTQQPQQQTAQKQTAQAQQGGAQKQASGKQQGTYKPTTKQGIDFLWKMNKAKSGFNDYLNAGVQRTRRMTEGATQEGRDRRKAGKMAAQMQGTPTQVLGLNFPNAQEVVGAGQQADGQQTDEQQGNSKVRSTQGPVPYGVVLENGKRKTQWLLPDGSLTTDLIEADKAEYDARQVRLMNQFTDRMKANNLDPAKQEDVEMQAYLDSQAPFNKAVDAVWKAAEAADAAYVKRTAKGHRFSLDPDDPLEGLRTQAGMDYGQQVNRNQLFDLDRMTSQVWAQLPQSYKDREIVQREAYYKEHPKECKGKSARQAAEAELKQEISNVLYQRGVRGAMPKSNAEFFARKVTENQMLSPTVGMGIAAGAQTGSRTGAIADMEAMSRYGADHPLLDVAGSVGNMALDATTLATGAVGGATANFLLKNVGKAASKKLLKGMTAEAATRYILSGKVGKAFAAAMQGGFGFAGYEGAKEMQRQVAAGGVPNFQTGRSDGYSFGKVLGSGVHGLIMGGITGGMGSVFGNATSWATDKASSTLGKMATRTAGYTVSKGAEAAVFSTPEWYELSNMSQDEFEQQYGKGRSRGSVAGGIYANNVAMVTAFGMQHFAKTVLNGELSVMQKDDRRVGMTFRDRVREGFRKHKDFGFNKDDIAELQANGYGKLADLFKRDAAGDIGKGGAAKGDPALDGYSEMQRLMEDENVSQFVKSKAYYIVTGGERVPMSTVRTYKWYDQGNRGVLIETYGEDGELVTRSRFSNKKAAEYEESAIKRQIELNRVNLGEARREANCNIEAFNDAARECIGNVKDPGQIRAFYDYIMAHWDEATEKQRLFAENMKVYLDAKGDVYGCYRPAELRKGIEERTGVDLDSAFKKAEDKRSTREKDAIREYIDDLEGDFGVTITGPDEDVNAPDGPNGGVDSYERGYGADTPEAKEGVVRRYRRMRRRVEGLFAEEIAAAEAAAKASAEAKAAAEGASTNGAEAAGDKSDVSDNGAGDAEADKEVEKGKTSLMDVVHTLYTKGKEAAGKLFQMKFFDVAKTPDFMKKLGLTGEKFTIKYGVIARHMGKDASHNLPESVWEQLPEALQRPFAISKLSEKDKSYRIYTSLKNDKGEYVVVGVDVKNGGRNIEVNAIATVFGRREGAGMTMSEELVYKDEKITPEQQTLLDGPNFRQYSATQELSEGKGNTLPTDKQAEEEKSLTQGAEGVGAEGDEAKERSFERNGSARGSEEAGEADADEGTADADSGAEAGEADAGANSEAVSGSEAGEAEGTGEGAEDAETGIDKILVDEFGSKEAAVVLPQLEGSRFSEEQKRAIADYLDATQGVDGLLAQENESLTEKLNAKRDEVLAITHMQSGRVIPLTLKDGRSVYAIGGNVVLSEDGTAIDSHRSDKEIFIVDVATGEKSTTSADYVSSVGTVRSAQEVFDEQAGAIRELSDYNFDVQIGKRQGGFRVGEQYEVSFGRYGNDYGTVVDIGTDEAGNRVIDVRDSKGNVFRFGEENLEYSIDKARQDGYEAAEAEREESERQRAAEADVEAKERSFERNGSARGSEDEETGEDANSEAGAEDESYNSYESDKSYNGGDAEGTADGEVEDKKSPGEERQDLTTTIRSTSSDGAKVTISKEAAKSNLYKLASRAIGATNPKGFIAAISQALGVPDGEHKQSFYFEFADKYGNEYVLRISNHNVNAENSDGRVPEISIVIKSKRQPNRFNASDAEVREYVYFKEDISKGDGQTLTLIAQDIAAMLDTGKYDDTSKLAVVNVSPSEEVMRDGADEAPRDGIINYDPEDLFLVGVDGKEMPATILDVNGDDVVVWSAVPINDRSTRSGAISGYNTEMSRAELDGVIVRDADGKAKDYQPAKPRVHEAERERGAEGDVEAKERSFELDSSARGNRDEGDESYVSDESYNGGSEEAKERSFEQDGSARGSEDEGDESYVSDVSDKGNGEETGAGAKDAEDGEKITGNASDVAENDDLRSGNGLNVSENDDLRTESGANSSEIAKNEQQRAAESGEGAEDVNSGEGANSAAGAMPMVHMKEDGYEWDEPDYYAVSPERTHAYVYGESGISREKADEMVANRIKAAKAAIDRHAKREPKMGTSIGKYEKQMEAWRAKGAELRESLEYWRAVAAKQKEVTDAEAAEAARAKAEREEQERLAKEAEADWKRQKAAMDKRRREVAEELRGDDEALEVLMDYEPHSLDEVAAMLLSGHKVLLNNVGGARGATYMVGLGREEAKGLFGLFARRENGGVSIDALSEDYGKEICEDFGILYDEYELRNEIIDMIRRSRTMSDIRNYIANKRIRSAREIHAHNVPDPGAVEYYDYLYGTGMTPDEYREYHDAMQSVVEEKRLSDDDYKELISKFAEADERYNKYGEERDNREVSGEAVADKGDEQGGDDGSGSRGATVLSGAEADERRGVSEAAGRGSSEVGIGVSDKDVSVSGESSRGGEGAGREEAISNNLSEKKGDTTITRREAEDATNGGVGKEASGSAVNVGRGDSRDDNARQDFVEIPRDRGVESDELDHNGLPLLLASDGTTSFGEIREGKGLKAGVIRLSSGFDKIVIRDGKEDHIGYGLEHIDAQRGNAIREAGFGSVSEFVEYVCKQYREIKVGAVRKNGNQTYIIEVKDDEHANVLYIELVPDGEYYNVNSGGVFRADYTKNKKTVEPLPALEVSPAAADKEVQEQGGSPMSGNSSSTDLYEGKGNTLSTEKQAKSEKSLLQGAENEQERENESVSDRVAAAEADVNTEPTEAQKKAGNYKMGHVKVDGFDVTIENPAGSVRRGRDADGKEWENTMHYTYGYIRGTEGVDGDHIDVFLSKNPEEGDVFVIDQVDPKTGEFDEHKVMYGFKDEAEAREAYLSNYSEGWKGLGNITHVSKDEFKKWVDSSHRKTKPFAEYAVVKAAKAREERERKELEGFSDEDLRKRKAIFEKELEKVEPWDRVTREIKQGIIDRYDRELKRRAEEAKSYNSDESDESYKGAGEKYDRSVPATIEEQKGAIKRIVDFAKKVKDRMVRAVIGGITERQKADFKAAGIEGVDDSWVHSMENSAVTHSQNQHGLSKAEESRGQVAITDEDYQRIPDILENYDRVSKSPNTNKRVGNDVIIYEKEFDDGYVYYLEEKRDRRKSLAFQTMYKRKKGTDSSDGLMHKNATTSTPVATSDNLSSGGKGSKKTADTQGESRETKERSFERDSSARGNKGEEDESDKSYKGADGEAKERSFGRNGSARGSEEADGANSESAKEGSGESAKGARAAVKVKRAKKIDMYGAAHKDPQRGAMTGVYHVDGHMVATDAQMMIDREGDYPKEYEGTSRDKRGNVIKGAYPPYKQIDGILRGFESGSGEAMDVESFRGNVERAQEAQKALGKDAMVLVEIGRGRNARYVTAENAKKILDVYDALGEGATMESKRRASSVFTGILVKGAGTRAVLMTHPDNNTSIESSYVVRDGVVMLPEALGEIDVKRIDQSLRDKGLKPAKVAMLEYQKRIAGNPVFKRQEKGASMNAEEAMDDLRELYRGNNYRAHNGAVAAMLRKACEDYIRKWGMPKRAAEVAEAVASRMRGMAEQWHKDRAHDQGEWLEEKSTKWLKDALSGQYSRAAESEAEAIEQMSREAAYAEMMGSNGPEGYAMEEAIRDANARERVKEILRRRGVSDDVVDELSKREAVGDVPADGMPFRVVDGKVSGSDGDLTAEAAAVRRRGVEVIQSVDELAEDSVARRTIEDGRNVTGWYDATTGKACLYMPNIGSVDELERSMRHEGVAHMGLRELLGKERFDGVCDRVWRDVMSADDRERYVAYVHKMSVDELRGLSSLEQAKLFGDRGTQRAAADEYMAFTGEDGRYNNVGRWEKALTWVRDMLRRIGFRFKFSDADIMRLLRRSEKKSGIMDNQENLLSLYENNGSDYEEGSETAGGDNDVERQADGSRVAADATRRVEADRDRSDIRVFEEGLAAERNGNSGDSERNRRRAESERLVRTAKENDRYLTQDEVSRLGERKQKPTGESVVYIDKSSERVYKVKDPYAKAPMKHGVQPEDAIYEHVVHNMLFPETRYKFEGVSEDLGDVRIVLSQKMVESTGQPTKAQIEAALAERGLKPEGKYTYGNEYVNVTDVTGDNALLDRDGKVYFIDPIIGFKKPVRDVMDGLSSYKGGSGEAKERSFERNSSARGSEDVEDDILFREKDRDDKSDESYKGADGEAKERSFERNGSARGNRGAGDESDKSYESNKSYKGAGEDGRGEDDGIRFREGDEERSPRRSVVNTDGLHNSNGALISAAAQRVGTKGMEIADKRIEQLMADRGKGSAEEQAALERELDELRYMKLYYRRLRDGEDVEHTMPSMEEHKRMVDTANEVAAKLGDKVVVYEAPGDIVDKNVDRQRQKRRSKGWYNPNTGEVYINLSAHRSAEDVARTVMHEVVGHKSIEELMGAERFSRFVDEIWDHAGASVRDGIIRLVSKHGWDYRKATKEYLAGLAETVREKGYDRLEAEQKSVWQRVQRKIEDFLNRILEGLKIPKRIKLSEGDLSYMMWKLYKHEERKAAGKSVDGDLFDKAEEYARREELNRDKDSMALVARSDEDMEMQSVNEEFNKQLDDFSAGEHHGNLKLGEPSEILKTCGLKSSEMFMTPKTLRSHMRKHSLTVDDIRNLPSALSKPIMVYTWGEKAKSLVVITDLSRGDQRITVAIKLERNGDAVEVNEIASVHGKDIERIISEMNTEKSDFGKDNLKYVDKEKAVEWLNLTPQEGLDVQSTEQLGATDGLGFVPPKGTSSLTAQQLRAAKIIKDFDNPVLRDEKTETTEEYRPREKEAPKRTVKVYKLMRLGTDGKLYPLFIDAALPTELSRWYDADSPNLSMLRDKAPGIYLVNPDTGEVQTREEFNAEHPDLATKTKYPNVAAINYAAENGMRWMDIEETARPQRRFDGENRKYWNLGINGSGSVATFSLRPGWHAGSLPTMRQIGKGKDRNLRDDSFVWVEGEVSADVDYTEEAERNPDKDLPDRIPEDGYYLKATNADKAKSQADRVGWYVAGAFKANRIISDAEARSVIDKFNAEHPDMKPVDYDWPRESGKEYDPESGLSFRDATEQEDRINEEFNKQLQNQIDGKLPAGHIYQIGRPGAILRAAGFPDAPIELSATHLAKKASQRNHQFDLSDIKGLPNALQTPLAVFRYGNKSKAENVIVGIDRDGKQFVVGVHFNQNRRGIEVSDIRGLFNKNNAEWLNWISQGKAEYLDKEKIQALIDKQRTNLAEVEYLDLDYTAKLVKDFENPVLRDEKSETTEEYRPREKGDKSYNSYNSYVSDNGGSGEAKERSFEQDSSARGNRSVEDKSYESYKSDESYKDADGESRGEGDAESDDILFREGDDEKSDLADMSIRERTVKVAMMIAERNGEDMAARDAAIEALGTTIGDLRKAMRAQLTYDVRTIQGLRNVANLLIERGGFLPTGPGEVKRLSGILAGGIGHSYKDKDGETHVVQSDRDIAEAADRLIDLFVDNQLRLAKGYLDDVMKIRAGKVNAKGVAVAGKLDVQGQVMVKAMRSYMDADQGAMYGRIAELDEIIAGDNEGAAVMAAAEKAGVETALLYHDRVRSLAERERGIREELRDHANKWNPKLSGDERQVYLEQKRELEESLRKARIDRAESLREIAGRVGGMVAESIDRLKAYKESEKARIEEIHHNANSDMEGRPFDTSSSAKSGLANNMAAQIVLAPACTFEQMMRLFGSKSVDGEGYLKARFVDGWQRCRDKEWQETQKSEGILNAKAAEILGKKRARWSDLYNLSTKRAGVISWWDGGRMKEHEVTQGNLMYIYMVNKQDEGRIKLRRMGITEEVVANVEAKLDPGLKLAADWLQEELLPSLRNKYNEVHMRMFGAPMDEIENYFPLKILSADREEEIEIGSGYDIDGQELPKTMTGAIVKRKWNRYALDVMNADAVSVALDHVREMETWAAFAEYRRDLGTLLSYKHFRNQVKNMKSVYGAGDTLWKKFYNLSLLVGGAYRPKVTDVDKSLVNATKLATAACITIRVNTALKQLLSYPAFMGDANKARLLYNMTPWRMRSCWKWAMENMPSFERRWMSRQAGNEILRSWKGDWDWTKKDWVQKVQRCGIAPNAFIDALTVSMGAEAVYDRRYKQYIKDGFSAEVAHERAVIDAEETFNLSQQSSELPYLSLMQNSRSWITTVFTNFRNSPMSYLRQSIQSKRELINMMKNGKTQREFEIKKGIREGLTEDQARMRTKRKWRRNWTRNMIKSATFDFILPALWAYGLNAAWYAIFGDDEKRKQEDAEDAIKRGMLGGFEGFSGGGTVPDVVYSIAQGDSKWVSVGRTPAEESVMSLLNAVNAGNMERAAQQGFNTLVSLGVGFNPQVIEDAVVAGIDFMGADEKSNREWAMLFMRVMSCPQSQIDRVYYDELGLDAREAQKRTPAELAERYATYKARRANFASLWMMDQERFEEAKEPYRKRFEKEAKARIESLNDESVNDRLAKYEDEYKAVGHEVTALGDLKLEERAERARELYSTERGERYKLYNGLHANLNAMIKSWLEADSPEKAAADAAAIVKYKEKIVEMLDKSGDKSASKQLRHEAIEIVKEWHKNQ